MSNKGQDLLGRQSIWETVHDELDAFAPEERVETTERIVFRLRRLLEAQAMRELRRGLSSKADWLIAYADGLAPEADPS